MLLFIVTLLARVAGVLLGVLYGDTRVTLVTVLLIATGLLVIALRPGALTNTANSSRPRPFEQLGTLGALAVTSFTLLSLVLPTVPVTALAEGCPRAPVRNAKFLATTVEPGVSARQGTSNAFAQVDRFPANCTLGFDAYCLGEPISDLLVESRTDNRWFVIPRHRGFAHAVAAILSGEPRRIDMCPLHVFSRRLLISA